MLADRQTEIQTDTHTHTDALITILRHRSRGRSKKPGSSEETVRVIVHEGSAGRRSKASGEEDL